MKLRRSIERASSQLLSTARSAALDAEYRKRLRGTRLGLAAMGAVVVLGTIGYVTIEGWPVGDSLYMVFITLSTVGFHEVQPLSQAGRYLTIVLIVTGVASFAYVAANFSRLAIEGELRHLVGRRRMAKEIAHLRDHFIICGYGRVGKEVSSNLQAENVPVVVVDVDADALGFLDAQEIPYIVGDAVEEEVMLRAGLPRARGLLLTLSNEADNVYVTLLAKDLRRDLQVVARSISEQGERRLFAAGADRVLSPERIGATAMSNSVLRPSVVEFAEIATAHHNLELQLEEQPLGEGSRFVGRSIRQCSIRGDYGLIVAGLVTPGGEMVFNPDPDYRLEAGATLIMLGKREDLARFAGAT